MNDAETKAAPVLGKPGRHLHLAVLEVNPGEPEERRLEQPTLGGGVDAGHAVSHGVGHVDGCGLPEGVVRIGRIPSLLASSE